MASSDSARRARGALRSAGVSFMPSGIQTLVTQVLPRALPMAAPISRERMQCSIQNWRMPLSRMRQREAIGRFGMRKAGGIEIQAESILLRPRNPVREMFRRDFVAVDFFAVELAVKGVQVQAMFAGDQRKGFLQIGAKFFRRARFAGIIAGGDQSAAERAAEIFKSADIVALPAVERNGNPLREFSARGPHSRRVQRNVLWPARRIFLRWSFSSGVFQFTISKFSGARPRPTAGNARDVFRRHEFSPSNAAAPSQMPAVFSAINIADSTASIERPKVIRP